jgi:putative Mg2+ transporter-C (MgtC) family protein
MLNEIVSISIHVLGATIAGGLIGIERSYHGRPAGFRTHTLVCVASSLLMLMPLYEWVWMPQLQHVTVVTDPTRIAQGIMTGIGFLGAGVIYKEGVTVRGLTTAASIWITAVIGYPAILSTLLALGILTVFRWIEARMPTQSFAHFQISFDRDNHMAEDQLRALLAQHHFSVANMSYRIVNDGSRFEYRMMIRTSDPRNPPTLADALARLPVVREFRISPTGD